MKLARAQTAAEPAMNCDSTQSATGADGRGSLKPGPTSLPPDCIHLLRPHLALADRIRFAASCRTLRDSEPLQDDHAKNTLIQNAHTLIAKFMRDRAKNIDELEVPFIPTVLARKLFGSKRHNIEPFKELELNIGRIDDAETRIIPLCDLAVATQTLPERLQAASLQRILALVHRTGAQLPAAAHVDAAQRAFRARAVADKFSDHRLLGELRHVVDAITRLELVAQGEALERLFFEVPRLRTTGYDFNGLPCIIETVATTKFTNAVREANAKLPQKFRAQLPTPTGPEEMPKSLSDIIEMLE